ncbi:MAG: FAD-dependent oxidoreductase, partial [Chloroflexi bacterium]|nr:FAD-dependent oxidoreductase [Chloroflexota bacterium]
MPKPVIFSVDDDPSVLQAITRDLRKQYGESFRIMRANSGADALEALRELRKTNDPVALFVVDQRMPQMNGVEFLGAALRLYPDAKRVLLTAYADTDAAINAINAVSVHYYLLKPWDPPEEKLYPVLDDLLEDWLASYRPAFEGIRILGHRWSPEAHAIKDFLARNQVPYQYLDVDLDPESSQVLAHFQIEQAIFPLVIYPDATLMENPMPGEVAQKVGLQTHAGKTFYDLSIAGGGPGGLAAAVYGASEGLSTIMIERHATGGQAGTSSRIENYLGFPSGLSGADLARRATAQAKRFGVEILSPQETVGLRIEGPYRVLTLADGGEIVSHAVVVAVGLTYRKLDVPGAEKLTGAGVYYGAALTEALSCQDQPAYIVGAGNSAGQAAMYLVQFASKVVMVVRGRTLEEKMSQYLVDRINAHPNIEVMLDSEIGEVHGDDHVEAVTVCNRQTGEDVVRPATALFIFIGAIPCTSWLKGVIDLDSYGFAITGPQLIQNGRPPKVYWPLDRD